MRIIPRNTKVKMQFYKGIGITDIILGVIALAFIANQIILFAFAQHIKLDRFHFNNTSNAIVLLYFLAIGILVIVAPMYIPIGDIKLYQALGYAFKFGHFLNIRQR